MSTTQHPRTDGPHGGRRAAPRRGVDLQIRLSPDQLRKGGAQQRGVVHQ
ncbi:hypothetical protein [Streptomyces thioluteus]